MGGRSANKEEEHGTMSARTWKNAFFQSIQQYERSSLLRDAALTENLTDWTRYLTEAVVRTCGSMGWRAAARGHELDMLPIPHFEYLSLDVVAFRSVPGRAWCFPIGVMELENSSDEERIAYSL
jgi:hypothetical protein